VVQRDGNSWEQRLDFEEVAEILLRDFLKNELLDMIQIFMCLHQWQQYIAYNPFLEAS
jgi:hypothetical protein